MKKSNREGSSLLYLQSKVRAKVNQVRCEREEEMHTDRSFPIALTRGLTNACTKQRTHKVAPPVLDASPATTSPTGRTLPCADCSVGKERASPESTTMPATSDRCPFRAPDPPFPAFQNVAPRSCPWLFSAVIRFCAGYHRRRGPPVNFRKSTRKRVSQ